MSESETAKAITKLVKDFDKVIQSIQKNVAKTKELLEELKKLKKG